MRTRIDFDLENVQRAAQLRRLGRDLHVQAAAISVATVESVAAVVSRLAVSTDYGELVAEAALSPVPSFNRRQPIPYGRRNGQMSKPIYRTVCLQTFGRLPRNCVRQYKHCPDEPPSHHLWPGRTRHPCLSNPRLDGGDWRRCFRWNCYLQAKSRCTSYSPRRTTMECEICDEQPATMWVENPDPKSITEGVAWVSCDV